jgi:hypothetical protein
MLMVKRSVSVIVYFMKFCVCDFDIMRTHIFSAIGIDVFQRVCGTHFLFIPHPLHLKILTNYEMYCSLLL